ncbi:tetratricopeptide repeat protein [Aquimarina sp. RZ0]|uniref:tetratricopeptide repeat protein n=1 Tax=Aquimarina sp. RZ0 TaxID=2607730 RepID=UPI0011F267BE|nr:tetratricopeptide repeat protein [Aquimarina sp. RZ0]KAA1242995.1 tetratricopeptide repeat protein [Aquimarina sp. RZ0]
MKTIPLIVLILLIIPEKITAQNKQERDSILLIISLTKVDTVKAINYLELSNLTMYNDQKKTFTYLEKADSLYKISKNDKGIAKLYAQKANYYYRLGKIDSARHYLINSVEKSLHAFDTLRAAVIRHNVGILDHYQGNSSSATEIMKTNIPVFKKYKDTLHLANAYLMKGKIAISDGYYNIALKETYSALKLRRSGKDDFRIAEDLLQIGIIYQSTDEHEKAIEILNESAQLYDKTDSDQSRAQALNYMGVSNIKLKNYEHAEENLKNALLISEKLDYKANIARVYFNWGNLELVRKNLPEAIVFFERSLTVWKSIGSPNNESNNLFYIGKTYLAQKKYLQSINYLNQSIAIAESTNDVEILRKAYLEKSLALEGQNKYKESLFSYKKNKVLNDSIFTIERTNATQELKIIFETEKKEQQIALQEKEIVLLEQKAKVSNLQRLLMGIGLLLAILGFYALRQKMKRNNLEKEKVDNELAFKKKELTTHALHLAKKNEVLEGLKQKAREYKTSSTGQSGYQQLIRTINFDLQDENNWENFSKYFHEVHKGFNSKAQQKYPQITTNDLRLMALLKMNLSSKEIANILNISVPGIKKARNRLRKKLGISPKESLEALIISI